METKTENSEIPDLEGVRARTEGDRDDHTRDAGRGTLVFALRRRAHTLDRCDLSRNPEVGNTLFTPCPFT